MVGGTSKEVEKSYDVMREDSYHIASYVGEILLWIFNFTAVALEIGTASCRGLALFNMVY